MSKKFKVIVSLAVAFLVVVGSVAVIGANSNHKETMAQSSSSARPVAKQRTHKKVVAKPAVKTTATKTSATKTSVDAVTPAETQTAEVTQVATTQNTNEQNQTEPVTSQTVAPAGQAQATSVSTAATIPVTPQPAVPFEKDAQGNASQAVVDYAQQNGLDLNGLQVGTIASESGSGYDVMIRDKKLAEQGQGDGVLNEYHVDKNGVVTPK